MSIPAESLARAVAVVGATGSGKTYAAKGALEAPLDAGARVCVLDPTGAWWGLRSSADGQSPGFPVVIFGGEHADIEITEDHGEQLGRIVAERTMQCVIDVSLMTMGGRVRFATKFMEELYRLNRTPLFLIFDEADLFAPQRPMPDQTVMLNRVEQIVRRGRVRGFRPWMITQRPAELHKSVLSQAATLIALTLRAPQDRDAIGAWIEGQADRDEGKKLLADLPKLKTGHGYIWCPAVDILRKEHFPKIKTFDSSRTPEDGETLDEPAQLAAVDLEAIRAALVVAEDKPTKKGATAPAISAEQLHAEYERGFTQGKAVGYDVGVAAITGQVQAALQGQPAPEQQPRDVPVYAPEPAGRPNGYAGPKQGAELRILRVLAARSPIRFTKAQWATLSGMKRTGGTWQTYVSRLRSAGYIEESDGLVSLTAAGAGAAGNVPRPQAGSVIADWKNALGSGPSKMIDQIISAHPHGMDRANLADRVGMVATGGTFQTYLSRLRSNGLIEVHGRKIKASDTLFIDGGRK